MFKPSIVAFSLVFLNLSKENKDFIPTKNVEISLKDQDYTLEANKFLKSREEKVKDLNDIIYEAIAKEMEEEIKEKNE